MTTETTAESKLPFKTMIERIKHLFIIRKDITKEYFEQKEQQQTLTMAHRMANTDALTNLYNRKGAYAEIEKRLLSIKDETDAFIIMDLDNFKAVND